MLYSTCVPHVRLTRRRRHPRPDQVDRNPRQHDQEPDPRRAGVQVNEIRDEQDRQTDVHERRQRVGERSIRPWRLGRPESQQNHGRNHQGVKRHIDRDDVFEQIVVKVAVLEFVNGSLLECCGDG